MGYGAVAERLGISPRTVFNWRRSPAFQSLIASEVVRQSQHNRRLIDSALTSLRGILTNS